MATLETSEVQTSRAPAARGHCGRHIGYRTTTYGTKHEEGRALEDGNAD
jgi:hypothetical protein